MKMIKIENTYICANSIVSISTNQSTVRVAYRLSFASGADYMTLRFDTPDEAQREADKIAAKLGTL